MAGKIGMKKKTFKRVFKRRRNFGKKGKTTMALNSIKRGGFPDTYFTPFTYTASALALGANTAVGYTKIFKLNDHTNNNSISPMGWSVLKQVYDVFLVHACRVKLTFQNTSTTIPCKVVVAPLDNDSNQVSQTNGVDQSAANFEEICQLPYAKVKYLGVAASGHDTVSINVMYKVAKISGDGMKKLTPAFSRFLGNSGSTNSSQAFATPTAAYNVIYGAMTSTGANIAASQVFVDTEVTYFVQLLEKLSDYA